VRYFLGASFAESLAKKLKTASIWKENATGRNIFLDQVKNLSVDHSTIVNPRDSCHLDATSMNYTMFLSMIDFP